MIKLLPHQVDITPRSELVVACVFQVMPLKHKGIEVSHSAQSMPLATVSLDPEMLNLLITYPKQ